MTSEMTKSGTIILLLCSLLYITACGKKDVDICDHIPFVTDVLTDSNDVWHMRMRRYDSDNREGQIAVVGPVDKTLRIAESLLVSDTFDNGSGARYSDGLPDFSGECIGAYLDVVNKDYGNYVSCGNERFLRELVVRNSLMALRDSCNSDFYGVKPEQFKQPAKVLILSSSMMSGYGHCDIDTLVNKMSLNVEVISPAYAMFEQAMNVCGPDSHVGIWVDRDLLGYGVYSTVYEKLSHERKGSMLSYSMLSPDCHDNTRVGLFQFLDMYLATGEDKSLSALLVDDMKVSLDSLKTALSEIMDPQNREYDDYRKVLSPEFEVIDAITSLTLKCYEILRNNNNFTHIISWPTFETYMTVPHPGLSASDVTENGRLSDDFCYSRTEGRGEDTYMLMKMEREQVSEDVMEAMNVQAVTMYSRYVSE